jgi:hypothetical protein
METYLRVERVDLTRDEPVGLLGVGVVDKVVFDLLGLGGHLWISSCGARLECGCKELVEECWEQCFVEENRRKAVRRGMRSSRHEKRHRFFGRETFSHA